MMVSRGYTLGLINSGSGEGGPSILGSDVAEKFCKFYSIHFIQAIIKGHVNIYSSVKIC